MPKKPNKWNSKPEAKVYKRNFSKQNYDVLRADIRKGIKPILLDEFKKDGDSMASGLLKLVTNYLITKGYTPEQLDTKKES